LEREKRDADKARLKASAEYDAMRAQIIRILDNEGELQDFHKNSQAYKDMFEGDQTPF
jgi:ribose 1,5-bisphosphokinase PhnN